MHKQKARRVTLVCVIISLLLTVIAPISSAWAADTQGTVTANINVRNSPDGDRIGSLDKGSTVTVSAQSGDWYKIVFNDGYGWCHSDYIKLGSAPATGTQPNTANRKSGSVNCMTSIKSGPLEAAPDMQQVSIGQQVTVTGELNDGWSRVSCNGIVGYIKSAAITFAAVAVETPVTPAASEESTGTFGWTQKSDGSTAPKSDESAAVQSDNTSAASVATVVPADTSLPYMILINKSTQVGAVLSKDANGQYTNVVRVMVVSSGASGKTPAGSYAIYEKYRWRYMSHGVYTQYACRFRQGGYLIHSVPYSAKNPAKLNTKQYNKLGRAVSSGCVRMTVADSKWIYDNCAIGTQVIVVNSGTYAGIPESVTIGKIPSDVRWDPTDPDPENPYYGMY